MEQRILDYLRAGDLSEVQHILETFVSSETFFDSTPVYDALREGLTVASRVGNIKKVEEMVRWRPDMLEKYPDVKEVLLSANVASFVSVCKKLSTEYVGADQKELLDKSAANTAKEISTMKEALGIDKEMVERIAVEAMFRELAHLPQAQAEYIRIFREHVTDLSPESIARYRVVVLREALTAGEYTRAAFVADQLSCSAEERQALSNLIQQAVETLDEKGMHMHADALRDVLAVDGRDTHLPLPVRLMQADNV